MQRAQLREARASVPNGQHQVVIASRTHTYPNAHTLLEVHERKAFLARRLLTGIACSLVFDTSDAGESNESCSLVRERLSGIHELGNASSISNGRRAGRATEEVGNGVRYSEVVQRCERLWLHQARQRGGRFRPLLANCWRRISNAGGRAVGSVRSS